MDRVIGVALLGFAALGGLAVVGLMGFTFFDIVSRPLGVPGYRGIIEISYISMIVVAYFGLPLVCVKKEHIVVDLATHQLPRGLNRKIDGFWILCVAIFLLVQAYYVGVTGIEEHLDGDRSTAMLWSPIIFSTPVVIGAVFAGLAALIYAFRKNALADQYRVGEL